MKREIVRLKATKELESMLERGAHLEIAEVKSELVLSLVLPEKETDH